MKKISFIGAGSTIFMKNLLGDCIYTEALENFEFALYDIDHVRLAESKQVLDAINLGHKNAATVTMHTDRKEALRDADYVVNAIQVGGYKPATVNDFEIPRKYGITQCIGDTTGVTAIMRGLRTIKAMDEIMADIMEVCPDTLLLNYANPMAMVTGYLQKKYPVKVVGLCHAIQLGVEDLLKCAGIDHKYNYLDLVPRYAGLNHMNFMLTLEDKEGNDIYPEIRENIKNYFLGSKEDHTDKMKDFMSSSEMVRQFGYFNTVPGEHTGEYYPFFIKNKYENLIDAYNLPIDEYLRRCEEQISDWEAQRDTLINKETLEHTRTHEYASYIFEAIETNKPFIFYGNVLNNGTHKNIPDDVCIETKMYADSNGITQPIQPDMPLVVWSLVSPHSNVYNLVIEGYINEDLETIYHAAIVDPKMIMELSIDDTRSLVTDLLEAHYEFMPDFIKEKIDSGEIRNQHLIDKKMNY